MVMWSTQLSKFQTDFKSREAIKSQVTALFNNVACCIVSISLIYVLIVCLLNFDFVYILLLSLYDCAFKVDFINVFVHA